MGQKVNPIGFRLGVIKGWDSNWYGGKDFAEKLVEDEKIRKYILARIPKGGISKIIIERTLKRITITINTARPGVVIGKGGQEVDKIKEELKKLTNKDVQINIFEIKRPELDAQLVGEGIAKQLEAGVGDPVLVFFNFIQDHKMVLLPMHNTRQGHLLLQGGRRYFYRQRPHGNGLGGLREAQQRNAFPGGEAFFL